MAGERPLWDFPEGTLAGRELSAYLVSRAAGWDVVPPTVYRDGPFGPGMCQLWIDADDAVDLVELARSSAMRGCGRWRCSTRWSTTPTVRSVTCCPILRAPVRL